MHRLAVIDPAVLADPRDASLEDQRKAWEATAAAVGIAMAGAEPLFIEVPR